MEDYSECELIDGVSPTHLNTFSNLFTYQHMLCIVVIVHCPQVHHVIHYKISGHTISCCYC